MILMALLLRVSLTQIYRTISKFSVSCMHKVVGVDVRRECLYRKYFYLLPAEIIGIKGGCGAEVGEELAEFNNILKGFEGNHPFHNYTARAKNRKVLAGRPGMAKGTSSTVHSISPEMSVMAEISDRKPPVP